MSAEEKADAKNAIDQAKDTDAVRAIVDKAKATNETREKEKVALDAAKNAAKEAVDKLGSLSAEEKTVANNAIDPGKRCRSSQSHRR